MLFATLDVSQRKISLDFNKEFILIDTVGFVSKLPHSLVDAIQGDSGGGVVRRCSRGGGGFLFCGLASST